MSLKQTLIIATLPITQYIFIKLKNRDKKQFISL